MELDAFVSNKKVEYTQNVITIDELKKIENDLGIFFGSELKQYLLKYGYLAYKHVELYGINSKQMSDSDMVKQTKYLHKYFPRTVNYIAIENTGDGNYVMVSAADDIIEFSLDDKSIRKTQTKLHEYIVKRFQGIDDV